MVEQFEAGRETSSNNNFETNTVTREKEDRTVYIVSVSNEDYTTLIRCEVFKADSDSDFSENDLKINSLDLPEEKDDKIGFLKKLLSEVFRVVDSEINSIVYSSTNPDNIRSIADIFDENQISIDKQDFLEDEKERVEKSELENRDIGKKKEYTVEIEGSGDSIHLCCTDQT